MLDKILHFLFRSRTGILSLLCTVLLGAFAAAGCLPLSMLTCMFDSCGLTACGSIFHTIDNCFSCNTGCGLIDCFFGTACSGRNDYGSYFGCAACSENGACTTCSSCGDSNCSGSGNVGHRERFYIYVDYVYCDQNDTPISQQYTETSGYDTEDERTDALKNFSIGIDSFTAEYPKDYYGSVHKVLTNDGKEISFDGYSLKFNKEDFQSSEYRISIKLYVDEKRFGETVDIEVDYRQYNEENETFEAVVGVNTAYEPKEIEGYTFEGFYLNSNFEGESYKFDAEKFHLFSYNINPDKQDLKLKVYAKYNRKENKVRVSLIEDGQTAPSSTCYVLLDYGTTVKQAIERFKRVPDLGLGQDRNGKKFISWAYDQEGVYTIEETSLEPITEDLQWYAIYKTKLTITLKNTSEPGVGTREISCLWGDELGKDVKLPERGMKEGDMQKNGRFTFDRWYKDEELANPVTTGEIIKTYETFYAKWNEQTEYNLTYYNNKIDYTSNSPVYYRTHDFNTTTELENGTAKKGYKFEGWRIVREDGNEVKNPVKEIPAHTYAEDLKLYGVYSRVVVLMNGGIIGEKTLYYGEPFELRTVISSETGKEFAGWTYDTNDPAAIITNENGIGESFAVEVEDSSTKTYLSPVWRTKRCKVSFANADGTWWESKQVDYGSTVAAPTSHPEKTGHTFDGWYSGNNKFTSETVVTKDVTYTAKFTPNVYTIRLYDSDKTTLIKEITVRYGEKVSLGTYPKTGKVFVGWVDGDGAEWTDYNGNLLEAYTKTNDIVLYAKYV